MYYEIVDMSNTSLLFQCLLGIQCQDFTILASDQTNTQNVFIMKNDEDRIMEMAPKIMVGVNGTSGDIVQFTQFISKNLRLYEIRNKYELDTPAMTHFIRKNVADGLRDGNPYILNMLIAGYDEQHGAQLYTIDFLASCIRVPFAAHGLGGLLSFSILDHYYKPTLTEVQAYEIIKLCIHEVQQRLFVNLANFAVKSVSKFGIKTLPTIDTSTFLAK